MEIDQQSYQANCAQKNPRPNDTQSSNDIRSHELTQN